MTLIKISKSKTSSGKIEIKFTENKLIFEKISGIGEALDLEKILPNECTELYINVENIVEIDSCGLALLIQIKKHYLQGIKLKTSDKRPKQLEKLNTLYLSSTGLI